MSRKICRMQSDRSNRGFFRLIAQAEMLTSVNLVSCARDPFFPNNLHTKFQVPPSYKEDRKEKKPPTNRFDVDHDLGVRLDSYTRKKCRGSTKRDVIAKLIWRCECLYMPVTKVVGI